MKRIIVFLLIIKGISFAYIYRYIPVDNELYKWYRILQLDSVFYTQNPIATNYYFLYDEINTTELSFSQNSLLNKYFSLLKQQKTENILSELNITPEIIYQNNDYLDDSLYLRLKLFYSFEIKLAKNLSFFTRFRLDTKGLYDNQYPGHRWSASGSEIGGYNDITAFIYKNKKLGKFVVGRQFLYWGHPYNGAMLLSNNAPSIWMIYYSKRFKKINFSYFSGVLSKMYSDSSDNYDSSRLNRYISGHRIDIRFSQKLQIALSETVLYGGKSRNPEPGYINPFSIYFLEQFTQALNYTDKWGENDNIMLDIEFFYKPIYNFQMYIDFFIDDFQYDMVSEPNEIGITFGIEYLSKIGFTRIEYTRINNWVYGQRRIWNRYIHYNKCLGHWIGPDAHLVYFNFVKNMIKGFIYEFNLLAYQKGEGSIFKPRKSLVQKTKFPSGTVEEYFDISSNIKYIKTLKYSFNFRFGYNYIKNYNHIQDINNSSFYANIELNYNFQLNFLTDKLLERWLQ